MLNIVIPMAGLGNRFRGEGFVLPKPLIPIHGVPMIRAIIANLLPETPHQFYFLCLRDHIQKHCIDLRLLEWIPDAKIIEVAEVTEGAACTVLLAKKYIDNDFPLMIANSDQWVRADINGYLESMQAADADGLIMTMRAEDPKWSYVRFDGNGKVIELVEKKVVSIEATVGIYNFRHGADFIWAAEQMIAKNLRVNNEFYVAPVYNELINAGQKIVVYNVGEEYNGMHGLGIPSDLAHFMKSPVSRLATAGLQSSNKFDMPVNV